jgi:tellurite resistance protein TerC
VSAGSLLFWAAFHVFILVMVVIDLRVSGRSGDLRWREAAALTCVWISLALLFAAGLWRLRGASFAVEFVTGYVVEYSLSVDNIFVFLLIFSFFRVSGPHQRRVLLWGIVGAILMRALMIIGGAALLARFEWFIYVFGAFLVWTGLKIGFQKEKEIEPDKGLLVRLARKIFPLTNGLRGNHFFVREGGRLMATPLLLVLVVVETTDVVFAVDSIPAVFGVTRHPFIVYTSNIFAILGLRSLYFLVSGVMGKFRYLKPSLAVILVFVGLKMCAQELVHISAAVSLAVIVGVLAIGVAASVISSRRGHR